MMAIATLHGFELSLTFAEALELREQIGELPANARPLVRELYATLSAAWDARPEEDQKR